ncbi:MAG: NAD(P)/FAD-dependent oxidoreductase [Gammaproteobacteria bacterium]|nr:NAD(P)/FAD-dependent oxidoreductase [Gammaproteobacteria bacterium]MCZ6853110.1 NAD(P)/FAD-dependent oxidoreductase [Gammaproteobacteria bacterium]
MTEVRSVSVAIIGAGAGGIAAAIKLREAGIDSISIFEKENDLGGTWRDNTYPGLICDVPSHLYRYSFAPNPDWSRTFSPGSEIYKYVRGVAEEYDVEPLISYDSEVTRLEYIESRWHLHTNKGFQGEFDVVISAVGILHHPVYPDFEGLDSFAGDCFHSARWDHSMSLIGKRIGIIGTGSTAVQIVGAVVDDVEKLSLFQRTPQWVLGAPNAFYSDEDKARYRDEPGEMERAYNSLARTLNHGFAAAVVGENEEALMTMQAGCQQNLDENIHDDELRRKLTPDYSAGCKRLIVSDLFYPAISKPNAELVTESISRIEPDGIRTADGRLHELDVLVLATGFDPHRFLADSEVIGRDGQTLNSTWSEGNYAYKTICVPGFPNLFFLGGPNSPIGNFSYLLTAETQYSYIEQLISLLRNHTLAEVDPKPDVTDEFNRTLKKAIPKTVWASGCQSWYFDKFGNIGSWPWTFARFEEELAQPVLSDFQYRNC